MSPAQTWPNVVRHAARLLLRIDDGELDASETIVYAVDTSVAFCFSDPRDNAAAVQTLGLAEDPAAQGLAHVLADLALHAAAPSGFVLLPAHDEEFLRAFDETRQAVSEESRMTIRLDRLQQDEFQRLKPTIPDPASDIDAAQHLLDHLDVARDGYRKTEFRYARWLAFIARAKVRSCDDRALGLPCPDRDDVAFRRLRRDWAVELARDSARNRHGFSLENDAEALAALGMINAELARRRDARRVRLLTTDDHMQATAHRMPGLPGAEHIRDLRLFIRDLPGDLAEFVDTREQSRQYGVRDWLRILLSPFADATGRLHSRDLVRLAFASDPDLLLTGVERIFEKAGPGAGPVDRLSIALREWNRFLQIGIKRHALRNQRDDPGMRLIADAISNGEALRDSLNRYLVKTASDASVSSLLAGLYMSLARRSGASGQDTTALFRMPVALRAGEPTERDEYMAFMDKAVVALNINSIPTFESFEDKYRAHLYYGVYFAAIGRWDATQTLAATAAAFAGSSQQPGIDGSEAAYLEAVAIRHRIWTFDDAVAAERARSSVAETFGQLSDDVRTKLERVALALVFQYGSAFLCWPAPSAASPAGPGLVSELESALASLDAEKDGLFADLVRKQALSNVVSLAMLEALTLPAAAETAPSPAFAAYVERLASLNDGLRLGSGLARAARSRYVDLLVAFGRWTLSRDDAELGGRVIDLLRELSRRDRHEMPYDAARFAALATLVTAALVRVGPPA